ncbi:dihydrodipicolinate synthase family protein [Labrys wisconsinensis]|uniref:4-hydroxy-tetrahydrodipicolinate synthase n=1 Tax=Labrys wisconsinensis TaxID=425677 RepID=A0ABU0JCW2_9HYPH|nr:dihydrodipicolinate synthase family protein [Labrys wisconsinensis]MDQ0472119.1 4-hydroxy-tetrahydrodipicolinate synthase [Labrys wisconsinensis]
MSLNTSARGVYAIAPTPFHADGRIDHGSIDRMTDFYAEAGCSGITVLGLMGEAPKLEPEESVAIAEQVIRRSTLPVVVGVSAPGFAPMRRLARRSMESGAAGVMIAPPPALRSDEQIVGYFSQAVEAIGTDIPWVLQDYPLSLGVVMSPGVIARIVAEIPSCVMLKHEDWPGLEKISTLRSLQATGRMRALSILCGNGGLFLDLETGRGADGAMTGYSFPEALVDLVRLAAAGERDRAHDLFDAHLPLIRCEQQPSIGLAVRKYLLMRRGILASDTQRKPSVCLTARAIAEIDYLAARLARHDERAGVFLQG